MLEKKRGVIRVEKLRAILLMEADFNFTNKLLLGSRMLKHAKHNYDLPDKNSGSRNGRSYAEVASKRRLIGDRLCLLNRAGCIVSANAHTCYDRIVHRFAILVCMPLGLPYEPLAMMFKAIVGMQYFVRTGFGNSTDYISCDDCKPCQGVCQGNGAGPAVWLLVSLMLVRFMHRLRKASKASSSILGVVFSIMGFMFVDNTDLVIIGDEDETLDQVIARAQAVLDAWG